MILFVILKFYYKHILINSTTIIPREGKKGGSVSLRGAPANGRKNILLLVYGVDKGFSLNLKFQFLVRFISPFSISLNQFICTWRK